MTNLRYYEKDIFHSTNVADDYIYQLLGTKC